MRPQEAEGQGWDQSLVSMALFFESIGASTNLVEGIHNEQILSLNRDRAWLRLDGGILRISTARSEHRIDLQAPNALLRLVESLFEWRVINQPEYHNLMLWVTYLDES